MKKIAMFAALVVFVFTLSACAKQDNSVQNNYLSNQVSDVSQEENILVENKIPTYNSESWKALVPETCEAFFDGCNNCRRMDGSTDAACTMMYCETYKKPICLDENK